MCRLKNLHFTLRRACTLLDHLACTHTLCAHGVLARRNTLFFLPPPPRLLSLTSRACPQFRGYLKNQRQTKTLPPPAPPPIQRGRAEKQCRGKGEKALGGGRRPFECRPRQGFSGGGGKKKGDAEEKEVNGTRVDLTGTFS